ARVLVPTITRGLRQPRLLMPIQPSTYGQDTKYGAALTGSDWPGLPLRIGHMPESGRVEGLTSSADAILVWLGGPSEVTIVYRNPTSDADVEHRFMRSSGMLDLLPSGTLLRSVEWRGKPSSCTSVNLPEACIRALCEAPLPGLDPQRGQIGRASGRERGRRSREAALADADSA